MLTTLRRIIKTAIVSFWRNRGLSLISTLVMVITLVIVSIFVSLMAVTSQVTTSIREKIDMAVYIRDEASSDQIENLRKMLLSREDVLSVEYISKEEALVIWQDRNKDNDKIRDVITKDNNPLPRSLEIKTKEAESMEAVAQVLGNQDYSSIVKEISYQKNRDTIDRMVSITNFIRITGILLTLVFVLISILVIYNTIMLTIFARSNEIEIMKLVGASDWYVRGPFVAEGLIYGFLATILASVLMFFGLKGYTPVVERYLGESAANFGFSIGGYLSVVGLQLMLAIILGSVCSILAVKKYIKT